MRSIIVGALLGIVFAGAMSYVGAKTAFIDGGNIPASIIAFGVLSAVMRRPTVHDGNVVQTISSSATMMSISGGLMGPVAALWVSGTHLSMPLVVLWGISVAAVGCMMAVPVREIFTERSALPFPSGTATAEVLKTIFSDSTTARSHLRLLVLGGSLCLVYGFARSWLGWIPEASYLPVTIFGVAASGLTVGLSWSPLLAGLGFLMGPRIGISLVFGATLAWVVIAPQLVGAGICAPDFLALLGWLLWPGVGLMTGGAMAGAVRAMRTMFDAKNRGGIRVTRRYLLASLFACAAVVTTGALAFDISPLFPAIGLVLAVAVSVAAARAQGETDNTPAGPVGAVMQVISGSIAPGGVATTLGAGGVVNGTLMHGATMLQNWKTGALTQTPPRTLFIAQLIGVVVGGVACAGAFLLIANAYGLGTEAMPAPAAQSWKATAEIAQHGLSAMPRYAGIAAAIGFVVGIVSSFAAVAKYAPSPVAIGMSFILPFHMTIAMALGGLLYGVAARRDKARTDGVGLPLASGAIAGEAIAGILTAILFALGITP